LMELVRGLPVDSRDVPAAFGQAVVEKLRQFRSGCPQRDDETIMLIQRS
jgi:serine phosphatase RsbU (regulator of sigma subunit)